MPPLILKISFALVFILFFWGLPVTAGSVRSADVLKASASYTYIHRSDRFPGVLQINLEQERSLISGIPVNTQSDSSEGKRVQFSDLVRKSR